MLALLLSSALAAPAAWFFPGPGPERAWIAEDGTLVTQPHATGGLPARTVGTVLARAADPAVLAHLPGVAAVVPLRGDGRTVRLELSAGADPFALSRSLHGRPDVRWAHPDLAFPLVLHDLPDDPYLGSQWHLDNPGSASSGAGVDVRAFDAWEITSGEGGLVAIVDSGVDTSHPDLRVTNGYDYADDDADSNPTDNAHGTAAAGLAAAAGDNGVGVAGVAWGADVYGIRLIGGETSVEDVRDAFIEATDAGAWVINNSWGFGGECPDIPRVGAIEDGLEYAEYEGRDGLGTVMVFSAGNGNCDIGNNWMLGFETVVAVAATSRADVRESYSCYGEPVDIAAPSGGVLTTDMVGDPGYGSFSGDTDYWDGFSGTSASAPIVSGVYTLMLAANPQLTAAEAREVVCDTATRVDIGLADYDEDGWSPWYGCGRIDAGAAVAAVANTLPGAVLVTGPGDSVTVDRVLLTWDAAEDPDGDPLVHEVRWWTADREEVDAEVVLTDALHLDLTGALDAGDVLSWRVRAVDAWGAGPEAAPPDVAIEPAPEEPEADPEPVVEEEPKGGCSVAPSPAALSALLLGLSGLARRRR